MEKTHKLTNDACIKVVNNTYIKLVFILGVENEKLKIASVIYTDISRNIVSIAPNIIPIMKNALVIAGFLKFPNTTSAVKPIAIVKMILRTTAIFKDLYKYIFVGNML